MFFIVAVISVYIVARYVSQPVLQSAFALPVRNIDCLVLRNTLAAHARR